ERRGRASRHCCEGGDWRQARAESGGIIGIMASHRTITRRRMLRMGAAAALAAGVWPGRLCAGDVPETEDFTFVAVNDLHYMNEGCGKWLEGAFKQMKGHEGVEFCLLVGDLVEDGRVDQLGAVKDVIQ